MSVNLNHCLKKISCYIALILYYGFGRYLPNFPFSIGRRVRGYLCKRIFKKCGDNVNIERLASFGLGCDLELGSNSGIGKSAHIFGIGGGGELYIGNNVIMAPDVSILTLDHKHDNKSIPIYYQQCIATKVEINDDVWIGYRAIILPGVKIGKGSIVGAGAVVANNIAEYSVAGGIPARVLKKRG